MHNTAQKHKRTKINLLQNKTGLQTREMTRNQMSITDGYSSSLLERAIDIQGSKMSSPLSADRKRVKYNRTG